MRHLDHIFAVMTCCGHIMISYHDVDHDVSCVCRCLMLWKRRMCQAGQIPSRKHDLTDRTAHTSIDRGCVFPEIYYVDREMDICSAQCVGWLVGWLIHWLICWWLDWLVDWFVDGLVVVWLADLSSWWVIGWLVDWLAVFDWLVFDLLVDLFGELVSWLIYWLIGWFID